MAALTQELLQMGNLNFQLKSGTSLIVNSASLKFETNNDDVVECRLQLEINPEQYQHIEQGQHFNLTPEIKGPHAGHPFQPDYPILLTVTLKPDLLPTLLKQAPTAEAAASYLSSLSQKQDISEVTEPPSEVTPLLQTENWLCLSVKQKQENEDVGFTTFWHSINPALLNTPNITSDQLAEGITDFVKTWTEANLAEATQTATTKFLQGITDTFGELLDDTLENLKDKDENSKTIFPTVIHFFEQEDWPFVLITEATALRLNFRGDNGQWSCYAKVNEEQQTFLFYSICPIPASSNSLATTAEFITHANYGLILGNFELDYTDGEIRYKTSINVEGSTLDSAQLQNLVYTNVMMMDQYLPGLLAVLEKGVSPEQAIHLVE